MKRVVLIACGFVALTSGIVGMFLPILPTTPFLLLAAACFLRSSEKLYLWLIHHRVFGDYILAYQRFKAVSGKAKVSSLVLLWGSILYSVFFVVSMVWLRVLLLLIAVSVSVHILCLKTLTGAMKEILEQERASAHSQSPP